MSRHSVGEFTPPGFYGDTDDVGDSGKKSNNKYSWK